MTGQVLRNLAELLDAMGTSDLSELGTALSRDVDPDFSVDLQPDASLELICGVDGLGVSFPTTLEDVWSTASELGELHQRRSALQAIAETLEIAEELTVEVDSPEPEPGGWKWPGNADAYPFRRPAPGEWTVEEWRNARFRVAYPGFEAEVLRPDGSPASQSDRLAELRDPEGVLVDATGTLAAGPQNIVGRSEVRDVLVVHIGRALRQGLEVMEAARGDWRVAPRSAEDVRFIVGVSRGSTVEGVFEVLGFEEIAQSGGGVRLRFEVEPTSLTVLAALPRMYGTLYFDRSDRLFVDEPTRPRTKPAIREVDTAESRRFETVDAVEWPEHPTRPDGPPGWLSHLLGADDIITAPSAVESLRAAHIAGPPPAAALLDSPEDSPESVYFAVVDPYDTNRVLSLHAVSPIEPGRPHGEWWSFASDGWVRDPDGAIDRIGRLRWVGSDAAESVKRQTVVVAEHRRRQQRGEDDDQLRLRLLRVLRQGGSDSIDLARGFLQWAWYPGGLHLEVGDGQNFAQPFDAGVWESLRWLGWLPPDEVNRNAWIEIEGDGADEVAYDLVTRTLSVLRQSRRPVVARQLFPPDFEPEPEWPVNPEPVSPDEPHYFDLDETDGDCLLCLRAEDDAIHWPPVVAFAPRRLRDSLDATRQAATEWAAARGNRPLVILDLLDAFPATAGRSVAEVEQLIDLVGIDAAAAALKQAAQSSPVRIAQPVSEQTAGLIEGLPRPFRRRPATGTALAALADSLSHQFTEVLLCTLEVVGDDSFFTALAYMPATQWRRGQGPHPFTPFPSDSHECYWCADHEQWDIHTPG